ncbi:MAG: hypothetical protein V4576_03235 [Patescibacteria group bacterium]
MKAFGIIIIVACLALNIFIGLFLFGKSIETTIANERTSTSTATLSYAAYGFSMQFPAGYEKMAELPGDNMVDAFAYRNGKAVNPVLQIYVSPNATEADPMTSQEYKELSSKSITKNTGVEYIDGGIATSTQGIKMYYDTILETDDAAPNKQKLYTFYINGNAIMLLWVDEPGQFDASLPDFEKIVSSVAKI